MKFVQAGLLRNIGEDDGSVVNESTGSNGAVLGVLHGWV